MLPRSSARSDCAVTPEMTPEMTRSRTCRWRSSKMAEGPRAFARDPHASSRGAALSFRRTDYRQRKVVGLQAALVKVLVTPPQEQQLPATLVREILVQAAVQLPVEVVPSSFKP
jgi:hypothetical protein